MKAVVFHGIGDIRLEEVDNPKIKEPTDAIVALTASAICGTDLHMIRGTVSGMQKGTILGHEGVGIVEEIGKNVRNLSVGDRVVIPSTIGCGNCSYCRAGYYAQCNNANPAGEGTAFFGGPKGFGFVPRIASGESSHSFRQCRIGEAARGSGRRSGHSSVRYRSDWLHGCG